MTRVRVFLSRALDLVLRRRRDDRLADEVQLHLDLLVDEYVEQGLSLEQARQAARRAFGGVDQVKAAYRDQRGLPLIDEVVQDVRFAGRLLRREPGFSGATIAVLALGIGVNNMLFTILNAHTIRGLPIRDVERVVSITTLDERSRDRGVSFPDFSDWQTQARSFVGLAALTSRPVVVAEADRAPERLEASFISAGSFRLVGTQPVYGRDFTPEDDKPGARRTAILGSGIWESRYGRDPSILDRTITVDGEPTVVVGIMPDRSGLPSTPAIWLPLSQVPGLMAQPRDERHLRVIGRLRNDFDIGIAGAEIDTIATRVAREHPSTNAKVRPRVVPINEPYLGSITDPAWIAFTLAGALVLLIACANAANLMLGHSLHRTREIAIRLSLGASRGRVVRQLLIEGALLAALAGTIGLVAAAVGVRLFQAAIPEGALPYWIDYSPDVRVLGALVVVSVATVFLSSLVPAIHGSRADVNTALKGETPTATTRRGGRWSTAFLAAEFGLAVVLVAHFVVNLRTAAPALPSDAVLQTRDVVTAALALPTAVYDNPERRAAFYTELLARLTNVDAVSSASLATVLPLHGGEEQRLKSVEEPGPAAGPTLLTLAVTPGYFATLGLPLVRGREFTEHDGSSGPLPAIVNERFAHVFFEGRDPIGQRVAVAPKQGAPEPAWMTIVGIAPSVRQRRSAIPDPVVYLPFRAALVANANLLVRSQLQTDALVGLLRNEVQMLDDNLPLYRVRTMAQVIEDVEWVGRLSNKLFLVLTFLAVILSTVGLYAVTSHGVSQRTHEIGVRMALGAQPRQIVRLVARRMALQLAIGFATGVALTQVWGWMFSSGRIDVTATDPPSLLAVAAILTAIATLACVLPARRAARLDPVAAIRHN